MVMPQSVIGPNLYAAVLAATTGGCKCKACQALRKLAPAMIDLLQAEPSKMNPKMPGGDMLDIDPTAGPEAGEGEG
jgi:hypothetical protein